MKRPRQYIYTSEPVKIYFHFFGWSGNFSHEVQVAAVITKTGSSDPTRDGLVEYDGLVSLHDCGKGEGDSLRNSFDFD